MNLNGASDASLHQNLDTSRDGSITAIDALLVINLLNKPEGTIPQFLPISDQALLAGESGSIDVFATTADNGPISLAARTLPPFASFRAYKNNTGQLFFFLQNRSAGRIELPSLQQIVVASQLNNHS